MIQLPPTQEFRLSRLSHLPELDLKQFQGAVGSGGDIHNNNRGLKRAQSGPGSKDPLLERKRKHARVCLNSLGLNLPI